MIHTMIERRAHMSCMRCAEDFGLSPPCTRSLLTCAPRMAAAHCTPRPVSAARATHCVAAPQRSIASSVPSGDLADGYRYMYICTYIISLALLLQHSLPCTVGRTYCVSTMYQQGMTTHLSWVQEHDHHDDIVCGCRWRHGPCMCTVRGGGFAVCFREI